MTTETDRLVISGRREGFALAGALLAMVVVGALITGSFFAASQENAIGLSSRYNDQALYTAEYAINQALEEVPVLTLRAMTGDLQLPDKYAVVNGDTIGVAQVWIHPFGPNRLFVAKATAIRGDQRYTGGTRVIGLMTHTQIVGFPTDRAMQALGGVSVRGTALISGRDTFPQGTSQSQWATCDTTNKGTFSVVTPDSTQVTTGGSAQIVGPKLQDATLDTADFLNYTGGVTYDQLTALATKIYSAGAAPNRPLPSASGGVCTTSDASNWGEPGPQAGSTAAVPECINYFPVIWIRGSGSTIINANGRGQGVLLVDGDLTVAGGVEFWGIVIVKGTISSSGNGGHLNGTVMAMTSGDINYTDTFVGNSVVELSSCAVTRAAANIPGYNVAIPLKTHSFIDLTAAGAGF